MKRNMTKKLFMFFLAAVFLFPAALPAAAAWEAQPVLSLSADLSADGKTVTLTVSVSASDPVCALQTDIVYDGDKLTAEGSPHLAPPWSGMLAASNIPESGTAVIAAAAAADVENGGGTVATMRFTVKNGASGEAVFYLDDVLIASTGGSRYEASVPVCIALDLASGSEAPAAAPPVTEPEMTVADRLAGTVILQDGNYAAVKDGALTHIDPDNKSVIPYINEDNRTMVPLRFIAEALGAEVGWDDGSRQVTIDSGGNTVVLTIDSETYALNGESHSMDTAPEINAGLNRTMVPVRFIMEALGMSVEWDAENRLVIITGADTPWEIGGALEAEATAQVLYLISDLIRDFI